MKNVDYSLTKFWQFFNHISTPGKIQKLVDNFFGITMKSLCAKFQPSSFKFEGGDIR